MYYSEKVILNELMWEYDFSKSQAESIIRHYQKIGKYQELCSLIQERSVLKSAQKELEMSYV